MKLKVFLFALLAFSLGAQTLLRRSSRPAFIDIIDPGVQVSSPGDLIVLTNPTVMTTVVTVGGETNGTSSSWSYFDSPGTVTFVPSNSLVTTGYFSVIGNYNIRITGRKGNFINTNYFLAYVLAEPSTNPPTPPTNIFPLVSITSPTNGAMFQIPVTITVNATASDSDGSVANVNFYTNGVLIAVDSSSPYSTTFSAYGGAMTLSAVATDNNGDSTSAAVDVYVDPTPPNNPPTASVTYPANGATFTLPTNIIVTATAADSDGTIASVEFQTNGVTFATDTSSPFSASLTLIEGPQLLTVVATDNLGLSTNSTTIRITNSQPPAVTANAGADQSATLLAQKTYFDTEYVANSNAFNSLFQSSSGPNYYTGQYTLDGTLSMYEATLETNYLNRALIWCETMVGAANTRVDVNGKKNWSGTWNPNPYYATGISFHQEDLQASTPLARAARIVMADADLSAIWRTRAASIYNFVRDHMINKQLVTRNAWNLEFLDWSNNTNSAVTDKTLLCQDIILDLVWMSAAQTNSDSATYGWATKSSTLAGGTKDYNGRLARFITWNTNGLLWSHGKTWFTYDDVDTAHLNRLPAMLVFCYQDSETFTLPYVTGVARLFTDTIWDQSHSSPQFKNFGDGDNAYFQTRPPYNNGWISSGFSMLTWYDTNSLVVCRDVIRALNTHVSNPSLSYMDSSHSRHAIIGNTAKGQSRLVAHPYASLVGVANGPGITSTAWTHVSGPATGYTIVKPAALATTILFTSAGVGTHVFRFSVLNAGPTVTDDCTVIVNAAPAL